MKVRLTVNGRAYEREVEPRRSLADFLREDLELTGTHIGCEHGVCGACTVLLNGQTVRSCVLFAIQAESMSVTTIEGLEAPELRVAFNVHHALQCGFCTPGMLLTAYELLQDNPSPNEQEVRDALSGQLCMCTGYVNIIRAVMSQCR